MEEPDVEQEFGSLAGVSPESDPAAVRMLSLGARALPQDDGLSSLAQQVGMPRWMMTTQFGQNYARSIMPLQQAQQEQKLQARDAESRIFQRATDMYGQSLKVPAGKHRKFIQERMLKMLESAGQKVDPEWAKMLTTLNDEEAKQQYIWMQDLQKMAPGVTLPEFLEGAANPDVFLKFVDQHEKLKSLELKRAVEDRELRQQQLLEGLAGQFYAGGALGVPDVPQGRQGVPSVEPGVSSPLPQASQAPSRPATAAIKAQIIAESRRQGVNPAHVLAIVEGESGFNPRAVGDGGKAVGLGQLHADAARDADIAPADRADTQKNIEGTVRYFKQKLTEANGDVFKAFQAYNAGSGGAAQGAGQQYAADRLRRVPAYAKEVAASPAGAGAIDLATVDREITLQEAKVKAFSHPGLIGNSIAKQMRQEAETRLTHLQQRKDLAFRRQQHDEEQSYRRNEAKGTPELHEFAQQLGYANANAIPVTKRAEVVEAFRADQLARKAAEKRVEKQIDVEEGLVANPRDIGPAGVPATRVKDLPKDAEVWERVSPPEDKYFVESGALAKSIITLEQALHDPQVTKYAGTILSDPSSWAGRNLQEKTKGLPEDTVKALANIALVAADFRRQYAGLSQTTGETQNLAPVLPDFKGDASPAVTIAKLRALGEEVARNANTKREGYAQNRQRAAGSIIVLPPWGNAPVTPEVRINPLKKLLP